MYIERDQDGNNKVIIWLSLSKGLDFINNIYFFKTRNWNNPKSTEK
jgi:hypothetical protein